MKNQNLSLTQRASIISLHKLEKSNREIARILQIPRRTIDYNVKKFLVHNSVEDFKRKGRPRKTSEKEDRYITQLSQRNRKLTVPEIKAVINNCLEEPVSVTTMKRRLAEVGLHGRVAAKKPLLRKKNMIKRLEWANVHKDWTLDDWKKVLWSDESKFEVFGSRRRVYIRRRSNEKFLGDCIIPTVKHGGGSVMVWGCFGGSYVGDLVKIEGILNKEGYKKIIEENVVSSGKRLFPSAFVFQQDNDPKHTSKLCKSCLIDLQDKQILQVMSWPPQSPDLNPIEMLWEELDRAVRKQSPTSAKHLWVILKEEWTKITATTLDKLLSRMPKLCEAIIKNKGGHIDEKNI